MHVHVYISYEAQTVLHQISKGENRIPHGYKILILLNHITFTKHL